MTPAGAEKLQKEISNLRQNDRSKLSARVTTLISSANNAASSELRTAQQDLGVLELQLNYLEELMRTAEVVTRPPGPVDRVAFGMTVSVRVDTAKETTNYTIVGVYESNPEEGSISWVSPIGKALIGKHVGDVVEINLPIAKRKLEVVSIRQA